MPRSKLKNKAYREKVLQGIKDYYNTSVISKSVRNMRVNSKMYEEGLMIMSDIAKKAIYDKYSIPYYADKQEFMKVKEAYQLSDRQKDVLWEEYLHRDKLIISGQYEDFRENLLRENYIKGLERLGATQEEIQQIRDLSDKEWEILRIPESAKDAQNGTKLPDLGLFVYNDEDYLSQVRKKIDEVFVSDLGKSFVYDSNMTGYDEKVTKMQKFINPHELDDIDDSLPMSKYYGTIDKFPASKILETKPDKYGNTHYYIRGLGSERTSSLVRDIVARKKDSGEI